MLLCKNRKPLCYTTENLPWSFKTTDCHLKFSLNTWKALVISPTASASGPPALVGRSNAWNVKERADPNISLRMQTRTRGQCLLTCSVLRRTSTPPEPLGAAMVGRVRAGERTGSERRHRREMRKKKERDVRLSDTRGTRSPSEPL